MLYTGFGGRDWLDFRICMVWSDDLKIGKDTELFLMNPIKMRRFYPKNKW